jgi:hypothetical protein
MKNVLAIFANRTEIVILNNVDALITHSLRHKKVGFVLKCARASLYWIALSGFNIKVDSQVIPLFLFFFFLPRLHKAEVSLLDIGFAVFAIDKTTGMFLAAYCGVTRFTP